MRRPPVPTFRPRLLDALRGYDRRTFASDLGAGVTVGIVALPLAMAFAIASGVSPEQGIFTAIVAGLLIGLLGGSNVQIGGPAGAYIVIVYGIVQEYGLANLLVATFLAGGLLTLMGVLRLGGLVRYIPVSIVIGFTNGIAVLIALSQVKDLFGLDIEDMPADFFGQIAALWDAAGTVDVTSLVVGLACLGLVLVWPKAYSMPMTPERGRQRLLRMVAHVPGTIVALVLATALTVALGLEIDTIGTRFGGIPRGLPDIAAPSLDVGSLRDLVVPTVTLALLGAIESLLCARVADNVAVDLPRHDPNQELVAQGVANMAVPFVGGIPATGTIARTVTNIRAGARTPVAAMVHSATLLVTILVAAPLADDIPLAAMAGLLMFVAWNMGEWSEFGKLQHYAHTYRSIVVTTFLLTIVFGLTVAVEVGLIMASAFFIYRMSQLFRMEPRLDEDAAAPAGVLVLEMFGSLFFGAVGRVESLAEQIPPDVRIVILDMHHLISLDTSGVEALRQLHRDLGRRETAVVLASVNDQPRSLIRRSGLEAVIGTGNIEASVDDALGRVIPGPGGPALTPIPA